MCVGGSVTTILPLEIACIDPHQTGSVGKGSDYLQLIKFWPSYAPGRGSLVGQKCLAPPYYSQHAVFASPLSAFFIIVIIIIITISRQFTCSTTFNSSKNGWSKFVNTSPYTCPVSDSANSPVDLFMCTEFDSPLCQYILLSCCTDRYSLCTYSTLYMRVCFKKITRLKLSGLSSLFPY